ncbi:DNA replication/repair protein RecF [Microbacterium sp. No. 7]|uniref:DNA replication/repair protein RecF n=1 Tax=Microbacterium sp. No. 7 TaxID=1714373 RepID=UPI0006ED1E5B|nr:DNA replication/repair protein RecF [Microbacterium sp. No. 7]ALJ18392.1 recombinase RecF [Microbacterium sp. No. 7]
MIVEQLSLADFRNYAAVDVALVAGANVFVGRNGQGKTNLAEAIAFLATLGSHRSATDAPLVRDTTDAAFVRARLAHGERRVLLEVQINRAGSNKARVNGSPVRTAELPRYAQVVLFAPEDLQIVRGDPSSRRRFADQLLVQRAPRMAGVLADYDRVVKQRNALLKSARARGVRGEGLSTLEVWDDKLVQLGTDVVRARLALADALAVPVAEAYASIAGADHRPELEWALSIAGVDAEDDEAGFDTRPAAATQPAGVPAQPSGGSVRSTGDAAHPSGGPTQSPGGPAQPAGVPARSAGDAAHPSGDVAHRPGDAAHPSGVLAQPPGVPAQSSEVPVQPAGGPARSLGDAAGSGLGFAGEFADRVPSWSDGVSRSPLPSADDIAAQFRTALAARRSSELERGVTLVGPHRDDLQLRVRGLPVKGYASHGESWSVALALRLASARLLREQSVLGDPIVILDDVFAELDADRRDRLAGIVADFEQVIVTAAVENDVPPALRARTVWVEAGTIREPSDD